MQGSRLIHIVINRSGLPDPFLEKIDKDFMDDPTWAKLVQLETIRTAMFSAKVHERIGDIDL